MKALPPDADERGFALIAAVASLAVFAAIALVVISATRIDLAKAQGELASAQTRLAAEGGLAIALHGLMNRDAATLALLDGRTQELDFAGSHLTITLIDERGKVNINAIEAPVIERMLSEAGLEGQAMAIARDSLLDWQDSDDEALPNGAEAPYYARQGITPRNGGVQSIDELGTIRGFTPAVVARLRPFVTVERSAVPFSSRYAGPQALAAIGDGRGAIAGIERQRELSGQRTAIGFTDPASWTGRPITVHVEAAAPGRGRYRLEAIVELTGKPAHPYVVRRIS
ncbi:type II secretion system protein GspK [Novosphingobium sp.]|uniref:general secretion pathway protein GspK n=1 Tax=Novosphingobium sp. TaxID=1874826 RepID=UPI001E098347|nr:type II secretion system protein GspK [Novosphingobium sp.]MBX9664021.1 general secretion pathway protein GspK [Novosphingobium sp.]